MKLFARRRQWLVHPRFQLGLLVANVLAVSLVLFIVGGTLFEVVGGLRTVGGLTGVPDPQYQQFVDYQTGRLTQALLGSGAIGLGIVIAMTMFLSHRMAGPVVRMKRYFEEMESRGGVPNGELSFRDGDLLNDLAPIVNRALAGRREPSKPRKAA